MLVQVKGIPTTLDIPGPADVVYYSNDPAYEKTVYLDGVNGNDANDGLTEASALQTYKEVSRKFPQKLWNGANILLMVASNGGFTTPTTPLTYTEKTFLVPGPGVEERNAFCIRAPQKCAFVPTTGPATAELNAVTPAVEVDQQNVAAPGAGYRTQFNFSDAAPGWTANNFRNSTAYLRVRRAGVDVIPESQITENGTDWLIIDIACADEILATDDVSIVRPSVKFSGPDEDLGECMITGGGSENIWADEAVEAGKGNTIYGVEFVGFPYFKDFTGGLDQCACSATIHFLNCMVVFMQCKFQASTTYDRSTVNRFQGNPRFVSEVNPIYQTSQYRSSVCAIGTMSVGSDFGTPSWFGNHDCVSHYGGSSLRVWGPGSFFSCTGSASARLMGSGATGSGLWARYGARIVVQTYPRTQIVGATGALRVGAFATIVNYGTGAGQFQEVAGYNGNLYYMDGSNVAVPLGDSSQISVGG